MLEENKQEGSRQKIDRAIDRAGKLSYQSLNERFLLVQKKQVATWKALSLVTFIAGLAAASIWFASYRLDQNTLVIGVKTFSFAKSEDKEEMGKGGVVGRAEDHILVKFKKDVSADKRQAALAKQNLKEKSEIKEIGVKIIDLPSGRVPEDVIKKMLEDDKDSIEFAEVDALMAPAYIPNDPLYPNEWHLAKMHTAAAWDSTKGGGITVAILDTGTDCTHPDLALNCVAGWNFYDNNSNTTDPHGHGTKVAGTVAAIGENLAGVAGVAYQAKVMPIRISDPTGMGYWSAVANGIVWAADRGARVATNSYESTNSASVQSAAKYLQDKGGIFLAAAGNSGALLTGINAASVVTVGATDGNDAKASWSNYGPQIDVTAPGVSIYTTSLGGAYGTASGTSFATPNTAAVFALIFSLKPSLSSAQAESILKSSAIDLGVAGRDDIYGSGRVDAAQAITATLSTTTPTPDPTPTPPAPTDFTVSNVTVSAKTATTATITWTTSLASTTGGVKYGANSTALTSSVAESQNSTTHSVTLSGLVKKTRYYYQVTATGPNGETSTSAVLNFTTKPR